MGISPLKENWTGEAVQFKSVFTQEDLENLPSLPQAFPNISQLHFDTAGIAKLLGNLDVKKSRWPRSDPLLGIENAAQEIASFLQRFFSLSLQVGDVPLDWKNVNVHAIFKKGDRSLTSNYRPISLTYVSCKIMEHIIFSHIMSHLEEFKILSDIQHGFRKFHSCEPNYSSPSKILLENSIMASKATLSCWTLLKLLIPSHTNAICSSYAIAAYKVQSTSGFKLGFAIGNNLF